MSWSHEQTDDPDYADVRNFYKVERWTRDGLHVAGMLYAGNDLERARSIFGRNQASAPSTVDYPPALAGFVEVAGDIETKPRGLTRGFGRRGKVKGALTAPAKSKQGTKRYSSHLVVHVPPFLAANNGR